MSRQSLKVIRYCTGNQCSCWSAGVTQCFCKAEGVTRGHNWKLYKEHNHSDIRQHSFSQRSINRWNRLSQDEVNVKTINSFKNCLKRKRQPEMDFFIDELSSSSMTARNCINNWLVKHSTHLAEGAAAPGKHPVSRHADKKLKRCQHSAPTSVMSYWVKRVKLSENLYSSVWM